MINQPIEGGCRCGACRYSLAVEAMPPTYACHCHQCQRWSGSAFSLQAFVPEGALTIDGPVVVYELATEDRVSTQRLCGICHTRLYNTNTRRPGLAIVRAGTLDRAEELECRAHIFTATKQAWFSLSDAMPSWRDAPDAEFMAVMMRTAQ